MTVYVCGVEKFRLVPDAGVQVASGDTVSIGASVVRLVPNGTVQLMALPLIVAPGPKVSMVLAELAAATVTVTV